MRAQCGPTLRIALRAVSGARRRQPECDLISTVLAANALIEGAEDRRSGIGNQ